MFSHTIAALEKFDNQHDFERMCADILNASGYKNVVLMAPRGGSDGGVDITFTTDSGGKGLACVTLRKDIDTKFKEDFSKRKAGEFNVYVLFCTAYLTASQKLQFTQYCLNTLQAEFIPNDIETIRSLLDSTMLLIREKYLHISPGNENVKVPSTAGAEEETPFPQHYPYDVALSYSSEDRSYAEALANTLQRQGIKVFYDKYEKSTLWGQDLYTYLSDIYQNKAHYCVIFISQHYATKLWTTHERKAAQARAFTEQRAYILPIRLDKTEIPGILPTVAYLDWHEETVESIAFTILEKLEDFSPKSRQQWFQECEAYWEDGYAEKALIASKKATSIDPYDWYGYYKTAWILERLEQHQEALAMCEQGIQRDPTNCEDIIYFVKAGALLGLKRYNEALTTYEQLLQNQYKHKSPYGIQSYLEALCGKGNVLFELERYDEAFDIYETAIQLGPIITIGYQNKGYSLYLLDRNEEALAVLEEAIRIAPKDAYSYQVKGDALYDLKRFEEALAAYEIAIQLKPKDKYSYRRKGDTLKALNRPVEAQQAYEVVKERQ